MATTTNLGLTLPTVGADDDTWGTISNTLDIGVDAVFAAAGSGTSVGLKVGSGKTLNALDGTVVLGDAGLTIKDTADPTKIAAFQCSGITAGQTRTLTIPDASDTIVGLAATQTLTNKTLISPTLTTPALGTPSSGTVTNLTGTASININGTVGATTPGTGAFTTLSSTDNITFTKSVNGELLLTGTNSNAGTGASTITRLSNGTTWAELSHNGTGYTTSGIYRQDGTYLYGNGAGGITLVTGANQPIYFAVAGSAVGQVTATGINSTNIGATTPGTGAFTTLSSSSTTALKGTTTNDSASAGNIGEYVTATVLTGSAVSLTTATAADITSISLTAGDWDVEGCVVASPAGGTTLARIEGWTSSTSATQPTIPNNGGFAKLVTTFTAADQALPVGRQRFSLSGTTTVYLSIYTAFIGSTCAAYGFISARRAR